MADGSVTIKVDLDGSSAQSGVGKLKTLLGGLESTGSKVGSVFKSVLGANLISSALTTGIGVVTGNIQSLSREAMSASDGLQKFESTMSFGGYDGATIKQARADVKSYADKTVYDINDVANTTAQLASNGIKNYTELTQAAGNLNAVAGGNANTFKTVGMVMTQTAGAGKLTTENWNQLADAIPGASGKLQEAMLKNGAYTGNFRKAMENGQITAEEFNQAITDLGMTDVAKEAATSTATFEGAIGNLQATIVSGLLNVVDKAKPKLIDLINSVTSFAGKIGDALGNLDIEGVISKVSSTISNVVSKVQTFWAAFSNTGAVTAFVGAIQSIAGALGHVWDSLTASSVLNTLASVLGNVVKWLSQAATVAANFISSLPAGAIQAIVGGLVGLVAGFKAFNFLKSFNPFNLFKQNATSGVSGATSVVRSASASVVSIIRSLGQSVATAARGIGQGIGAAFRGIGQGLAMVNPATIAALAVPILALGAAFALMGMQGQGIATILQGVGSVIVSVGTAIGTILNLALQGLAQALVIVAPVLPTIASAFAMLAPVIVAAGAAISMIISSFSSLAPVITALGIALSQVITAISSGIAQIAIAVTPIVAIISNAFVQVVTVVSQAIVQIIQALAPFIPVITQMVVALAPVLQSIVDAFNNLISQISPIIDSITNLFKTLGEQISSILESAGSVVESFGSAIRNVLDGVAGIFESMGNAAKNAGQGVKLMAQGIKMLVDLKLGDLVGTLAAVATGLTAIAGSGIASAGPGLQQAGTGLRLIAISAQVASVAMQALPAAFSSLNSSIGTLPSAMTTAGSAMTQAVSTMRSSMTQMVSVVRQSASQMTQAGQQAGRGVSNGVTNGIRSGIGSATAAMSAMVNAIRLTAMAGAGAMRGVGAMIGQGLAQGMYSALGAVTAAANALVAQAERAAQAKAKIHSPSRLFRDNVGRYIAQGIAVGIEKNTSDVTDSLAYVQKEMSAFKFGAEELLGLGNGSLSSQFKLKSITERAEMSQIEIIRDQADKALTKALEVAEQAVKRPVNMVLDDGALVAKIGQPMTNYQNDKIKIDNMMRGIV